MPNDTKNKEWEVMPNISQNKIEGPIETRCAGVLIGRGHNGDGFLIHWPEREGFNTPMDYDMIEGSLLNNNCFDEDGLPDDPGVYSCLVELDYDKGDGWDREPEWTFYIREAKIIDLPFIKE